jgi:hypothetical protein
LIILSTLPKGVCGLLKLECKITTQNIYDRLSAQEQVNLDSRYVSGALLVHRRLCLPSYAVAPCCPNLTRRFREHDSPKFEGHDPTMMRLCYDQLVICEPQQKYSRAQKCRLESVSTDCTRLKHLAVCCCWSDFVPCHPEAIVRYVLPVCMSSSPFLLCVATQYQRPIRRPPNRICSGPRLSSGWMTIPKGEMICRTLMGSGAIKVLGGSRRPTPNSRVRTSSATRSAINPRAHVPGRGGPAPIESSETATAALSREPNAPVLTTYAGSTCIGGTASQTTFVDAATQSSRMLPSAIPMCAAKTARPKTKKCSRRASMKR